nr:expressed conserved protein [Hymenolepis microstoma]
MAKTVQLTWGLSLRLLKTPLIFLDPQFAKRSLSSLSLPFGLKLGSRRLVRQPCSKARTLRNPKSKPSNDDFDLDLFLDSPHLTLQIVQGRDKMTTAGGMRFIVYLVSLALSLAALSTLKLHKLLEWLTLDSDVSMTKSNIALPEFQTKSSLISEILQAASQRYSQHDSQECSMTASTSPSYLQSQVYPSETSHSAPTSPIKSRFHSENSDLQVKLQRRSNSESFISFPPSPDHWIKAPQVNVEIRTQAASGRTSWCLSVDLFPPTSFISDIAGLCLSSTNRVCRLSFNTQTPDSFCPKQLIFPRSSIVVAHAVPLTSNLPSPLPVMQPSTPYSPYSSNMKPEKPISSNYLSTNIEEAEQEIETASFIKEPLSMCVAPITSNPTATFNHPTPKAPTICRDCSVDTRVLTRDCACSPIPFSEIAEDSSEIGEHSDADGLELDDEGVYFAHDYPDRVSLLDDADYGNISDIELQVASQKPEDNLTEQEEIQQRGEGFSNLVSIIRGISDDLLQLESGCQELIQRVHVNRIDLDRVNESLSYVWNYKDTEERMERSWSDAYSSNVPSHRYTPMGASFISTTGSCCACNCHSPKKEPNRQSIHEPDTLYLPALSFDDYEYSETYGNRQYPLHNFGPSSSHQCLLLKSSSFQNGAVN